MRKYSKAAAIYATPNKILVSAMSRTTAGAWVRTGEVLAVGIEMLGTSEFAMLVLKTLDQSEEGVPHPTSWKGFADPLFRAAGVERNVFYAIAKRVEVSIEKESEGRELLLAPMRNLGASGGFVQIKEKIIRSSRSGEVLARELSRAIELCE